MRPLALLLAIGCSRGSASEARPGRVDWVRGLDDHLEIGVVGPVDEVLLDGPDGTLAIVVEGASIATGPLSEGSWTVRVDARDPGLTQRVGGRLELLGHLPMDAAADVKGEPGRVVVSGGRFEGAATVTVVDITDPRAPEVVWEGRGMGMSRDAAIDGRYMYVARECGCEDEAAREAWDHVGLHVIDLEAPGGPTLVAQLGQDDGMGGIHNLTLHGDVLYLSDNVNDAVQVVDVSDPTHPAIVDRWSPARGIVHDQTVEHHPDGDRLLVATWQGIGVLDLTDPLHPVPLLDADLEMKAVHQAWPVGDGEHILLTSEIASGDLTVWRLADDGDGMQIAHVAEANPYPSSMIHNVVARGLTAYAAWYSEGLVAVDIADPTLPFVIARHPSGDLGPAPAPSDGPFVGAFGAWVDPSSPVEGPHLVAVSDTHAGLQLVRGWPEVVWYPRDDSNVRPTD